MLDASRSRRTTSRSSARSSSPSPTAWPRAASSRSTRSTMVLSHPQALGQCTRWLAEHLPRARRRAGGVDRRRRARGRRRTPTARAAAIGPRLAARRYGAVTLAEDLEDDPGNATRFAWLARPRPHRRSAGRPGEDDAASSGAPARPPRAGSSPAWPCSRSRASTSPGSSHARCAGGWASTCSSSTSKGRWRAPTVAGAVADLHKHAEVVRVLGSFGTVTRVRGCRYTPDPDG